MTTLFQAMSYIKTQLEKAGQPKESAARQARYLAEAALQVDTLTLLQKTDQKLSDFQYGHYLTDWIPRFLNGCPVSRLQKKGYFADQTFIINEDTLDPRPETEALIQLLLKKKPPLKHGHLKILELGVGSGCLLLTLLRHYPDAQGIGTDLSPKALKACNANVKTLGLQKNITLRQGDWFQALAKQKEPFDIIVSNPPYIPSQDILHLDKNVRLYDPHLALDGGKDGLTAYRTIIPQAPAFLKPNGILLLEIGFDQGKRVKDMAKPYFQKASVHTDDAQKDRAIWAENPYFSDGKVRGL